MLYHPVYFSRLATGYILNVIVNAFFVDPNIDAANPVDAPMHR